MNSLFSNVQSLNPVFQNVQPQMMSGNSSLRLVSKKKEGAKVAAVVVTFCSGCSYDSLFTSQEQKSEEGSQTLVYAGDQGCLREIINGFNKDSKNPVVNELVEHVNSLDVDCTVFNWECCSSYSGHRFINSVNLFEFVGFMLNRGHMLMFSDFSLKALVSEWNVSLLGPNPFIKVNEFTGNVVLKFNAQTLKASPSAQLQLVGSLSEGGMCNVNAAGGTIGYTVNWQVASKSQNYKFQLLSIASNISPNGSPCQIGSSTGAAGHCLLTYPKGGKILTSMTHWISLMQIDTSEKKIIQIAQQNYGAAYANDMEDRMRNMGAQQKSSYVQSMARQYVQTSAPCNNMYQKAKYFQG